MFSKHQLIIATMLLLAVLECTNTLPVINKGTCNCESNPYNSDKSICSCNQAVQKIFTAAIDILCSCSNMYQSATVFPSTQTTKMTPTASTTTEKSLPTPPPFTSKCACDNTERVAPMILANSCLKSCHSTCLNNCVLSIKVFNKKFCAPSCSDACLNSCSKITSPPQKSSTISLPSTTVINEAPVTTTELPTTYLPFITSSQMPISFTQPLPNNCFPSCTSSCFSVCFSSPKTSASEFKKCKPQCLDACKTACSSDHNLITYPTSSISCNSRYAQCTCPEGYFQCANKSKCCRKR